MIEQTIDLSYIRGFLSAMAAVNDDLNHGCNYLIYEIPVVGNAKESFWSYFGEQISLLAEETLGAHKLEDLHSSEQKVYNAMKKYSVETVEDGVSYLHAFLYHWFFGLEYSPVAPQNGCKTKFSDICHSFICHIEKLGKIESVHEVSFYQSEVQYGAVMIFLGNRYLFFHLGFSD